MYIGRREKSAHSAISHIRLTWLCIIICLYENNKQECYARKILMTLSNMYTVHPIKKLIIGTRLRYVAHINWLFLNKIVWIDIVDEKPFCGLCALLHFGFHYNDLERDIRKHFLTPCGR